MHEQSVFDRKDIRKNHYVNTQMLGKRILALPINLYNTNNYEEIIAHILTKVKKHRK